MRFLLIIEVDTKNDIKNGANGLIKLNKNYTRNIRSVIYAINAKKKTC